jgi:hypothetical protein
MISSVMTIDDIGPEPDMEAIRISEWWSEWKGKRNSWEQDCQRRRDYIFAVDTRTTDNATLPWKNSTTTPKLCQIRDNLHANYMAAMFPNDNWLQWEGSNEEAVNKDVVTAIQSYMKDKLQGSKFKNEVSRLLYDYIDYGNAFAAVQYVSDTHEGPQGETIPRYSGPIVTRISPLDIVFDIGAAKFKAAPKIIRSVVSMGQLQADVSRLVGDDAAAYQEAVQKIRDFRTGLSTLTQVDYKKKSGVAKDGFGDLQSYAHSPDVEILTFYGDLYIANTDTLLKNHKLVILDRRYVLASAPLDNEEGEDPIHHVGWRLRPDNLMAMGPLDNLVGLQYRIDHLENLRADMMDMTAFPMTKIKGDSVEDFNYEPAQKIYMDTDDDVEFLHPDTTALQADMQIARHMEVMEEMAGSPKQAMGFRTPGEKTAFEVQQLENAAGRIFQNKIRYFEELFVEPIINTMFALSKRNAGVADTVREVNPNDGSVDFRDIAKEDITHSGRLRPVGARHFVEKAQAVQNLQNLFASPMAQDPLFLAHWSPLKLALATEDLLGLSKYKIVGANIRVMESADTNSLATAAEDQVAQESLVDTQEP